MEEFPSGQRGQTVNLLRFASVVRIHPPPPRRSKRHIVCSDFFIKSQNALILLLLLSKSQPLRWVVICCRRLAAFFDCGKRSGLNGACRKRWSQTGSQFSFQRERRPLPERRWQGGLCGEMDTGSGLLGEKAVNRTYVLFTALLYRETAPLSRGKLAVFQKLCLPQTYCTWIPLFFMQSWHRKSAPPPTGKAARRCFYGSEWNA